MGFDGMLMYVIVSLALWLTSIIWMAYAILDYNLFDFFMGFAMFWLYPIPLEMLLNAYGCLTSSSLRRLKHGNDCEELCKGKFPIIYSHSYNAGLLGFERMHGLDHKLPFYIYRKIEEEEIIDSKEEQYQWERDERARLKKKREEYEKRQSKTKVRYLQCFTKQRFLF